MWSKQFQCGQTQISLQLPWFSPDSNPKVFNVVVLLILTTSQALVMQRMENFFKLPLFAVVGASNNRDKFGNKVLRCYIEYSRKAVPISKTESIIEGLPCFKSLAALKDTEQSLPPTDVGVSIITAPPVTKQVIQDGIQLGYRNFFLQPGTTDSDVDELIREAKELHPDLNVIEGCVLVSLPGFSC